MICAFMLNRPLKKRSKPCINITAGNFSIHMIWKNYYPVLKQHGLEIPPEVDDADVLTDYAWGARYPRFGEPVTEDEYHEAVRQAETVVTWSEKQMKKR